MATTVLTAPSPLDLNESKEVVSGITTDNLSDLPTEKDYRAILIKYNDEKAELYIPVIVYMILLTVIGTFGNILVCFVYCNKPSKASSTFFIMALAILDLLTCIIGMPTEITDLRYPYMFHASGACKLLRFTESVTTIGSSVILISVAVDRYLRICKLGKQISVSAAKRICVLAMGLGILLSWPTCFIFGRATTDLEPNVVGVDCSTDDSMDHTHYPSLYYGFLGLLFLACITFFSITYCKIGLQIWRQKKTKIGEQIDSDAKGRTFSNSSTKESHSTAEEVTVDPQIDNGSDPISTDMSSDQIVENTPKKKYSKDRRKSSVSTHSLKAPKKRTIKVTRTTIVLFAVTVAYVISFLPFLIVMVMRSIKKDFEENLTVTEEVIIKFCVKSYFINNAINPLIYSFLNINFRLDAKKFLTRMFNSCCCLCRRNIAD